MPHRLGTLPPRGYRAEAEADEQMAEPRVHRYHDHDHGPGCGHTAIRHDGHLDYLHDGHMHHPHEDRVEEHVVPVSEQNPDRCTPEHDCGGHRREHVHGPGCGHDAVPHGEHTDYLVEGHLHHPHHGHCDDHGPVEVEE